MEGAVLLMVCLSPWAFGAADPPWEFLLLGGVGVVLALWGAVMLLEGRLTWRKCPVALCLAALYLLGVVQATPLPPPVLAAASPAAARLYGQVLPAQPEALPGGEARAAAPEPPGSTISLYPGATRRELVRLLAVFLLFAAVRNNIASAGAFRRLAVAATANGALLSLFALLQYFSSPHQTVYWAVATGAEVFGPFICRNHFPFYVNLCVGLAAGLLVRYGSSAAVLHDSRRLWVGLALVLMLAAVALSLSRGGLVALAGGAALFLALRLARSPRLARLTGVVLVAGGVIALVAWFGADRVKARLATVIDGRAAREDRIPLWSRVMPLAAEYPILGSGYGTFDYLEPTTRTTGEDSGYRYEHAHNDYLEALLEGGVVRLGLSLLALGLVIWLGARAFLRGGDGLALGGLFGVAAVAVHSFFDFGLHIPAIAVLTTVVCADLCGGRGSADGGDAGSLHLPPSGAGPVRGGGRGRRPRHRPGRGWMDHVEGGNVPRDGGPAAVGPRPGEARIRPGLPGSGGRAGPRWRPPAHAAGRGPSQPDAGENGRSGPGGPGGGRRPRCDRVRGGPRPRQRRGIVGGRRGGPG